MTASEELKKVVGLDLFRRVGAPTEYCGRAVAHSKSFHKKGNIGLSGLWTVEGWSVHENRHGIRTGVFRWVCTDLDGRQNCRAVRVCGYMTEVVSVWIVGLSVHFSREPVIILLYWVMFLFLLDDNYKSIISTVSSLHVLALHGSQIALHCIIALATFG